MQSRSFFTLRGKLFLISQKMHITLTLNLLLICRNLFKSPFTSTCVYQTYLKHNGLQTQIETCCISYTVIQSYHLSFNKNDGQSCEVLFDNVSTGFDINQQAKLEIFHFNCSVRKTSVYACVKHSHRDIHSLHLFLLLNWNLTAKWYINFRHQWAMSHGN